MPSQRPWTLIMPYYENPGMLKKQLDWLSAWPEEERAVFELIIVDDGSPRQPAVEALTWEAGQAPFAFQLYRMDVDVRWNWIACRNLAMSKATHDWRLMTDIDHLVPVETATRIRTQKLRPENIYRFSRLDWPGIVNPKPHPNTWLMHRDRWEETGGYDERFSGFYGTDGMFRDRCIAAAKQVVILPHVVVRVSREVEPDASTTTYGRKEEQDREGVQRIRGEILKSGKPRPQQGLFPWHRVL